VWSVTRPDRFSPWKKDPVPIVQKGEVLGAGLDGVENLDPTGTVLTLTSLDNVCAILAAAI